MFFDSENILENKLIILYALSFFKTPLTREQISQIILENVQISYFDIQFLLQNLKEDDFVDEITDSEISQYSITQSGKSTLQLFKDKIPSYLSEIIAMFISQNKDEILKEVKYQSSFKRQGDNQYMVNLKLYENKMLLIDLNVNVVNREQAKFICSNWDKSSSELYNKIIHALIN